MEHVDYRFTSLDIVRCLWTFSVRQNENSNSFLFTCLLNFDPNKNRLVTNCQISVSYNCNYCIFISKMSCCLREKSSHQNKLDGNWENFNLVEE